MCVCYCRYVKAEGMERTYHLKQGELAESVPIAASMSVRIAISD